MEIKINKKILYVGSLNGGKPKTCGQTLKTQLIKSVLEKEGFELQIIDLSFFTRNPLKQLRSIKKGIKECDVVFAIPGPRAAHVILPFLKFYNRKNNKKMIYCAIGAGYVSEYITKKSPTFYSDFSEGKKLKKPNRSDIKTLKAFSYNLFETQFLCDIHERYYGLNNCFVLENFRCFNEAILDNRDWGNNLNLKMIYCSRITKEKGILDLLQIIYKFNKNHKSKIFLDVFGDLNFLSSDEKNVFSSFCKDNYIKYMGILDNCLVVQTMSKYHLFCLPTKFLGEGTPGAISESLIAGTPVICSSFYQAKYIIKDGIDGIIFDINHVDSLSTKLENLFENKGLLLSLHRGAVESGKRFLYSYQRDYFLKYIID